MVHKVLIDENLLGWAKKNEFIIKSHYEEIIPIKSKTKLPQGIGDVEIGVYCEEENCNIITSDYKMYVKIFKNKRIKAVQIEKMADDHKAKKDIYLIRIL